MLTGVARGASVISTNFTPRSGLNRYTSHLGNIVALCMILRDMGIVVAKELIIGRPVKEISSKKLLLLPETISLSNHSPEMQK